MDLGLSEWCFLLQYYILFFTMQLTSICLFILLNNVICFYGNQ